MRGFDQVWYGSVTRYDAQAMENWLKIYEYYPEVGGKDPRPLLEASVHTLVTDIIEVAADARPPRACALPGAYNDVEACGPVANWTWGYFAVDFVRTGEGWKIWHMSYTNDVDCICGQSWGKEVTPYPEEDAFAPLGQFEMPPTPWRKPSVPCTGGSSPDPDAPDSGAL